MVKRYTLEPSKFCPGGWELNRSTSGELVHFENFDRMRRRLVVKWLKTRRRYLHKKAKIYDMLGQEENVEKCDRWASFYWSVSRAIERGEPLEYFNRLGQDK